MSATLNEVASMDSAQFARFAQTYSPSEGSNAIENSDEGKSDESKPTEQSPVANGLFGKDEKGTDTEINAKESDSSASSGTEPELDLTAFYNQLIAPIKAAGKELVFKDVEEIRTLVQKGIGFEQRMGKVKQFQRQMETLERENLLNDDVLNLIVDLARGKPEALKQYIDTNKIDIYDIISIDATAYSPEKHIPSEEEYEQHQVVQEIRGLKGFELIQDIADKTWDKESRDKLLADPVLASNMIEAANLGIHAMVLAEAEKVKLLASSPISDLDAYITAGTKLHKQGAFDKMVSKPSNVDSNIQPKSVVANHKATPKTAGAKTMADIAKMSVDELKAFAELNNI